MEQSLKIKFDESRSLMKGYTEKLENLRGSL